MQGRGKPAGQQQALIWTRHNRTGIVGVVRRRIATSTSSSKLDVTQVDPVISVLSQSDGHQQADASCATFAATLDTVVSGAAKAFAAFTPHLLVISTRLPL